MRLEQVDGITRVVEACAYPWEYGFSPYSNESLGLAEDAGELLFSMVGSLLEILPGPEEGVSWPALRLLPVDCPGEDRIPIPAKLPLTPTSDDTVAH